MLQRQVDRQQVVQRVLVLGPIEPPQHDAPDRLLLRQIRRPQFVVNQFQKCLARRRLGLLLLWRWHLVLIDFVEHLDPLVEVLGVIRVPIEGREIEAAGFGIAVVAFSTMLRGECPAAFRKRGRGGGGRHRQQDPGDRTSKHGNVRFLRWAMNRGRGETGALPCDYNDSDSAASKI